jgi:hypothetical protein
MNKKRIFSLSALGVGLALIAGMPAYATFSNSEIIGERYEPIWEGPTDLIQAPVTVEEQEKIASKAPVFDTDSNEDISVSVPDPSKPYDHLQNQERPVFVPEYELPGDGLQWNLDNSYTENQPEAPVVDTPNMELSPIVEEAPIVEVTEPIVE